MTKIQTKTRNNLYRIAIIIIVFLYSCVAKPPVETGIFKNSDLVELIKLDSTFRLDIRYATNNNFVGRPVYEQPRAFLQRPAAAALIKVNREFRTLGYGLLIFDGYRPWTVTKLFWDMASKENKKFVADPKKGSKHNRGCAVDLSLFDLSSGKEIKMPGEYDESTERSYCDYKGGTEEQRKMRDLLRGKMEANGFKVYEYEWWHFDYVDWKSYRIQNIPFSQIK
jgi:zinc D-Ala-D-Ala dipeptidase